MSPAVKSGGSSSKKSRTSASSKKPAPTLPAVHAQEDSEADSGDDGEGEDGVDEAGMNRLMAALGDDGLDDYELAQLANINGDGSEDENGSDSGEEESASDAEVDAADEASEASDEDAEEEDELHAGSGDGEDSEEDEDVEDDDDDDDDAVALDEVESVDDDVVPRQKIEIDNKVRGIPRVCAVVLNTYGVQVALDRIRDTIKLDPTLPWTETLALSYPEEITVDVEDDLNREVALYAQPFLIFSYAPYPSRSYKQALHGANAARALAVEHNLPFTRPADYFAEMVKSDAHMERIRQRLLDEGASIKRGELKRKEREGKKFGKQVQLEKARERERGKKEMEEKLKGLKRSASPYPIFPQTKQRR